MKLSFCLALVSLLQLCSGSAPMWLFEGDARPAGRLASLIDRVGPHIRASSNFHDYEDHTVEDSASAWRGLESQARQYAQGQVEFYRPKIDSFLASANVSSSCRQSAQLTLDAISRLDSWAIQLWNSNGNFPPAGVMDGQFTDVGSYHNCINMPEQQHANTSYCLLTFRPVIPRRRQFHLVFQKESELIAKLQNQTTKSANIFGSLARQAQYFNYLYLKVATCVPSECSPRDMQQVSALIARHWFLVAGPVQCHTRAAPTESRKMGPSKLDRYVFDEIENEPILVQIEPKMNSKQLISLTIIVIFYTLVALSTIWHLADICMASAWPSSTLHPNGSYEVVKAQPSAKQPTQQPLVVAAAASSKVNNLQHESAIKNVAFNYLSVITNTRDFLDTSAKSNEITCLHGLRVLTMIWIITVHCLQYNEWSGFTRIFSNEKTLMSPLLHPIYNANYVVDNFFFMSGLLASFSSWTLTTSSRSSSARNDLVRVASSIINRYLRLTPQVLLVSMLYILLPLLAHGPFWYDMTQHAAKYCERNWWINLLHVQAFYREDEMCNLVGWWISVDMFFYLIALVITYLVVSRRRTSLALQLTGLMLSGFTIVAATKHYLGGYPPNNLGTIPQVAEVWTRYVVNYFWSPFTHAYPFFLGLWVGHILAHDKWRQQVKAYSRSGSISAIILLISINMSSHIWMSGRVDIGAQWISTLYNCLCPILWISGFAWLVMACHYGCMPLLNRALSNKPFVLISKASFIVYLSHMLEVRMYFGSQVTLLEVSPSSLGYIIIANAFCSIVFGIFLCITFEGPSMKFQKLVATKIRALSRTRDTTTNKNKTQLTDSPESNVIGLKEVNIS